MDGEKAVLLSKTEVEVEVEETGAKAVDSVVLDVLKQTIRMNPPRRRLNEVERLLAPFLEDMDRGR